jgi:conjugative transfer pilus assembly protein TraH|tara:strand:- start:192 stop:1574 length:1383 start_codon:yes stop_codon:yes gene_type:complete
MMRSQIKNVAAMSLAVVALSSGVAKADMGEVMQNAFDSMTYTSTPQMAESQRRGVISGGRLTIKNKIMNESLINVRPPSFSAGCGGLDMYGGSFSFINGEQFVQLLRSVAANAKGYAFKLAISAMCETCDNIMETIQKKIQQLNQMTANSCQLAQGIMNDTVGAALGHKENDESLIGTMKGFGDSFESFFNDTSSTPNQNASSVAPDEVTKTITGNLTWRYLKQHNASGWFAAGDDQVLRAILSLVGTVVVAPEEENGDGEKSNPIESVMGASINFADLIDGGSVTLFRCADGTGQDECLEMVKDEDVTLVGFKERFREMLIGTTASMGIVQKLANQIELSDEERAFLASTPFGGMLYKLAPYGETASTLLVEDSIERLAFDMAYITVRDMVRAALTAVQQSDHSYANQLNEILIASSERIDSEVQTRAASLSPASDIMKRYQVLLEVLPNKDVIVAGGL